MPGKGGSGEASKQKMVDHSRIPLVKNGVVRERSFSLHRIEDRDGKKERRV
jgi:hypothetical protein